MLRPFRGRGSGQWVNELDNSQWVIENTMSSWIAGAVVVFRPRQYGDGSRHQLAHDFSRGIQGSSPQSAMGSGYLPGSPRRGGIVFNGPFENLRDHQWVNVSMGECVNEYKTGKIEFTLLERQPEIECSIRDPLRRSETFNRT
jgi:hypothetical protein